MIPKYLQWIVFLSLLLIISGKYLYDGITSIDPADQFARAALKQKFIEGKCTEKEEINRWLLQQSWFYDPEFKQLAGAFGQDGFSLYEKSNDFKLKHEGVFCISGKNLHVTYYQSKWVPRKISFKEDSVLSIKMGLKMNRLSDEIINIKEISEKKIKLFFKNENTEYVFYRKS